LPGWLYRVACREASNQVRGEVRRRQREAVAMSLSAPETTPPVPWERMAPLLDEAMRELPRTDQDAVVLRYFQGKSLRETGAALKLSEEAARKRIARALDKMRGHFARRGVTASAALLAEAIGANAAPAVPAALAGSVTGASLAGAAGAASGAGSLLLRTILMNTNVKTLLAAAAMVTAVAVPVMLVFHQNQPKAALPQVPVVIPASSPAAPMAAVQPTPGAEPVPLPASTTQSSPFSRRVQAAPAATEGVPIVHSGILIIGVNPDSAKPWPVGAYLASGEWSDAGADTPEAALQTYLWAQKNGNSERLAQLTTDAPPVVVNLAAGGVLTMNKGDLNAAGGGGAPTANQSAPEAATGSSGPLVVTPGSTSSPYDPNSMAVQTRLAFQGNQNFTTGGGVDGEGNAAGDSSGGQFVSAQNVQFVPASESPPQPDPAQMQGASIASSTVLSPDQVEMAVNETWPDGTQQQQSMDFQFDGSGWKYVQHHVEIHMGGNQAAGP
jgi:hypothetical protein